MGNKVSRFNIQIAKVVDGVIPLLNTDEGLYVNKGNKIIRNLDQLDKKTYLLSKGYFIRFLSKFAIIRRVLRLDVADLVITDDNGLIIIKRGGVLYKEQKSSEFRITHKILRGSRPLNLCKHVNGKIYWGEYFDNPSRGEVYIYESKNGIDWKIKYTFPEQSIRHIHGIYWDKYRKGMWVLTGDKNSESGLWFTGNEFETLECINRGSQKARAVSIISLKDRLIVPMDSPKKVNYIQEYYPKDNSFNNLKELPGSAFHTYSSSNLYLVSTVVEPSIVNQVRYVEVFASLNCKKWYSIARLHKDFLSSLSYKYFRYPEVVFVKEQNLDFNSEEVYLYCRGVKKYNNKMLCIKKDVIISYISKASKLKTLKNEIYY